jgi:IS5 family transposase
VDQEFLQDKLTAIAQQNPKFRYLQAVLTKVFTEAQVRLAMQTDLVAPDSQAAWNGRPALPLVVTGSLAVVRRLMGWGYRTLMEEVNGHAGWRWVCGLYYQPLPNFRTVQRREAKLRPETLTLIHQRVIALGEAWQVTTGERLRVDSSVTETNTRSDYPTDSSLLNDAARVLSRLLREARGLLKPRSAADKAWFRDRHRQAKRLAREIGYAARKSLENKEKTSPKLYVKLIALVEQLLAQVEQVQLRLVKAKTKLASQLGEALQAYGPMVQQVMDQATQRILQGKTVAAQDKLVSLFEPHTAIIVRGKAKPKETQFGAKVWYTEVDGGLISEYRLLVGNPYDADQVIPSLHTHRRLFGRMPKELTGDRNTYSPENEKVARALGVKRVALPYRGHKSACRKRHERQPWFRAALRFRNGIEGRISQLQRARALSRCLNHGRAGLERWVGWGVVANNIAVIVNKFIRRRASIPTLLSA